MAESNGTNGKASSVTGANGVRRYDAGEKQRGLVAIAVCNGNAARAHALLKEQGITISERTLCRWKVNDAEDYQEIRAGVVERIRQDQAEKHAELMELSMEVERRTIQRMLTEDEEGKTPIDKMEVRDLPGAHRNASVATGVHADKVSGFRGDPSVVEHRSQDTRTLEEIERKLEKLGLLAERPVVDAEVVEPAQLDSAEERAAA